VKCYLGLGSNLGNRKENLYNAINRISELPECKSVRVSPVYETPALLPEGAPNDWNRPFLNLALEMECDQNPEAFLGTIQEIERAFGRGDHSKWSPRTIDIDILLWGDQTISSPKLEIPHAQLKKRAFVLDPLKDLKPDFLGIAKSHPQHSPIWMGIMNITPDSFSDGGSWRMNPDFHERLDKWDNYSVGIIDVGGESTRPRATPVNAKEEWRRISPILSELQDRYDRRILKPLISVDTRHVSVAKQAIEAGASIINDVSGLVDPEMIAILKDSDAHYVLTHSLSVPANTDQLLPEGCDPVMELTTWFQRKTAFLESSGIARERIIIDPGIGFGKTPLQSIEILRNLEKFKALDYRLLVGHSRKSFLCPLNSIPAEDRDHESVGVSLNLTKKGADILRVHNPVFHIRSFQAWNHLNNPHPL
jgi:2-amino-4-hydroxy-6-hydroxymethyldihydropteridine diphosphokinase/dihydropteroate synthase